MARAARGRADRLLVEVHPIGEDSGVHPDELELGVVLHPDHWGQGIALEAGAAVARDLFERVGRERLYAGVEETNDRSLRLLAKVPGSPASGRRALRVRPRRVEVVAMSEVLTERNGAVLTITLSRPDVFSAFNAALHARLRERARGGGLA